jgi:hypothetical protein
MRRLIVIAAVIAAIAAVWGRRSREPRYAYGRWRADDRGMPRIVPIIDVR